MVKYQIHLLTNTQRVIVFIFVSCLPVCGSTGPGPAPGWGLSCLRVYRSERNIGYKNSNHSHDQSITTRLSLAPSSWRGLFFCRRTRSHTPMDPDLENVIRQALADAHAAERTYLSQTKLAVRAALQIVPLLASRLVALGRSCPGLRIHKYDTACR